MGPGWGCIMSNFNPKGSPMAYLKELGKVGITVELGGRSATSPEGFARVGRELADSILNILRHYGMYPGEAQYPSPRYKGEQEALLAPASGIYIPEPGVKFLTMMKKGDPIARIVDIWGDTLADARSPRRRHDLRPARAAQRADRRLVLLLPQGRGDARLMQPDRDLIGYADRPPVFDWPGGARVAVNFVLNVEEGAEYSTLDGDGRTDSALSEVAAARVPVGDRDLGYEGMVEYGSRVGVWRILRLFRDRGLPLTVFAAAQALERNPPLAAAIAASDWDVVCHGWRWAEHYLMDEATERAHIARATTTSPR
jgi:hypothetical protein